MVHPEASFQPGRGKVTLCWWVCRRGGLQRVSAQRAVGRVFGCPPGRPPAPSVTGVTSRCRPSLPLNLRIPCDTEPLTSRAAPGPRLGHCSSPAPRAVSPYPLSSLRVQGNPHGSGCSGLRRARSPATAPSVFGHLGLPTTATSLCPGAPAVPPANGCQPLAAHDILRQSWGEGGGREGAFPDRREPGNDGQPWGPVVKGPRGPQVVFQCNQTGVGDCHKASG